MNYVVCSTKENSLEKFEEKRNCVVGETLRSRHAAALRPGYTATAWRFLLLLTFGSCRALPYSRVYFDREWLVFLPGPPSYLTTGFTTTLFPRHLPILHGPSS
ncbi:hypothetical protein Y032_0352g3251 [Ancylostoma ceylanicum]|uniref:Uncharacterized protein n=1 Tax=Ancylostoma ceylanicum TaxID=53326 RepID=A0A016RXJ8_9BILA|nr:hypothetical protein Y032_0352g3251 [Ancylostoma ceylanicum]